MEKIGNLYEKIYNIDNLELAHKNARRGKIYYKDVKMVDGNEEFYLKKIQEMLINKTYKTSEYEVFKVWDKTKERTIYKLPYYPDRIVQ
jgi:cellulose synthase/poly-beta-1,6-N-acetylglucosamine synthase-like glycosyltransferase